MSDVRSNGTKRNERDLQARLDALRADLRALQNDMRGLADGVGDAAGERIAEMLRTTEDMAGQVAGELGDWTNDNIANLRKTIREQPLLACGLAMSVGAIFGALLSRR